MAENPKTSEHAKVTQHHIDTAWAIGNDLMSANYLDMPIECCVPLMAAVLADRDAAQLTTPSERERRLADAAEMLWVIDW